MAHTSPQTEHKFPLRIVLVTILVGIGFCAISIVFLTRGSAYATVVETITGETPEAKVGAYVNAVARGQVTQALTLWELPTWQLPDETEARLSARRQSVTQQLAGLPVRAQFNILGIQWWSTCCEPHVIPEPRDAGGARLYVQLFDKDGMPLRYVFDLFTREQPYWGAALNYPPRQWVLRDVYPDTQAPLFWTWSTPP
jgi:hypothetical protein